MSENIFGILINNKYYYNAVCSRIYLEYLLTTSITIMQYEREYIWNTY